MLGTFDGEWFGMYYYLRHQTKGITNIYFYSHNHRDCIDTEEVGHALCAAKNNFI